MSEGLICPMRKSGGPCVEECCAWWDRDECSILSIAKTLYLGMGNGDLGNQFNIEHKDEKRNSLFPDDDIPF